MSDNARRHAEAAARASYGRLIAFLAARSRDIAGAEDALAEAFSLALETWPARGIPDRPEAWLLTVARREMGHAARRRKRDEKAIPDLERATDEAQDASENESDMADRRLELLFVCAHPAIDPAARTPLMLQTVLGLDAARIASAFLVSPATMSQRLVRAKTRIKDAGIPFAVPDASGWRERLDDVLAAIYAAYGTGWEDVTGGESDRRGLSSEAIFLARLLCAMIPDNAEAAGLLALMLHCEARRPARRDARGAFVPLSEQDPGLWSQEMIVEAEQQLSRAAGFGTPGRYQIEAAIQSVHAGRARSGRTEWGALCHLYDALVMLAPSTGALVGRAAAYAEARGPQAGLDLLAELGPEADGYQPTWALRAHLLARTGAGEASRAAYDRAIGMAEDPSVRDFLLGQKSRMP